MYIYQDQARPPLAEYAARLIIDLVTLAGEAGTDPARLLADVRASVLPEPDPGRRVIWRLTDAKNDGWRVTLDIISWARARYGFTPTDDDQHLVREYTAAYHRFDDTADTYRDQLTALEDRALAHANAAEPGWQFSWQDDALIATSTQPTPPTWSISTDDRP